MSSSRRLSTHLFGAALLLPLIGLGLSAFSEDEASSRESGDSDESSDPIPPPANTETAVILMRSGLDARDLAAAGVDSSAVTPLVDAAKALINEATLEAADLDYAEARSSYETLVRKVRSGLATSEEVLECQTLHDDCDAALATRDGLLQGYFDAAAATLDSSASAKLVSIRANASWDFPEEYLVVSRDEREWIDLREALATERISQKYGEDFPDEVQSYLATERARVDVSDALRDIAANYAAVQTAWNAAVSD